MLKTVVADDAGIVEPKGCLDVRVSKAQRPRALRIANALLEVFAEREWPVHVRNEQTIVHVGDVPISLSIEEVLETFEIPTKPRLDRSGYTFHYNRVGETRQRPSGSLMVSVRELDPLWGHHRRSWRDGDSKRLEQRLHQVLVGMLRLASAVTVQREAMAREAEERRIREEERLAELEEQRRLRDALAREKGRVEQLLAFTARWHRSNDLRRFVEEVRNRGQMPLELGLDGGDLEAWLSWALDQADRIDPFVENPPSILDRADEIERVDQHRGYR